MGWIHLAVGILYYKYPIVSKLGGLRDEILLMATRVILAALEL